MSEGSPPLSPISPEPSGNKPAAVPAVDKPSVPGPKSSGADSLVIEELQGIFAAHSHVSSESAMERSIANCMLPEHFSRMLDIRELEIKNAHT
jgi:hypothetical protein